MNLFDLTYSQASLLEMLDKSGIGTDSLDFIPWAGDSVGILDETGNMLGYITDHAAGGVTISDAAMKPLASSMPITDRETLLLDGSGMNAIGFSQPNPFGGEFVSSPDGVLTLSSMNDQLSGLIYDGHAELLATAGFQSNALHLQSLLNSPDSFLLNQDTQDLLLSGFDPDLFGIYELFDL